jgi:hypothetical protein
MHASRRFALAWLGTTRRTSVNRALLTVNAMPRLNLTPAQASVVCGVTPRRYRLGTSATRGGRCDELGRVARDCSSTSSSPLLIVSSSLSGKGIKVILYFNDAELEKVTGALRALKPEGRRTSCSSTPGATTSRPGRRLESVDAASGHSRGGVGRYVPFEPDCGGRLAVEAGAGAGAGD